MQIAVKVAKRYVWATTRVARFKAPRTGFPPEVAELAADWTNKAEERGHDLRDWKLRHKGSPEYGWVSKCVRCNMQFVLSPEKLYSALYRANGWSFSTEGPIMDPAEWANSMCEIDVRDLVRGLKVEVPDPQALLAQDDAKIEEQLLKLVIRKDGVGKHWTNPANLGVAQSFAMGRHPNSIPVVLHAQYRADDQRRNAKKSQLYLMPEFAHEEEVYFSNREVLRIQAIEWFDGARWVRRPVNVKTTAT